MYTMIELNNGHYMKLMTLILLSMLSFTMISKAEDDVTLPVVSRPLTLEEETQGPLDEEQIANLVDWATNSKESLITLLENNKKLPIDQRSESLATGIKEVVAGSKFKQSELLMRYILNRGMVINTILTEEMDSEMIGAADVKSRILISSIELAIKYFDNDLKLLANKSTPSFAIFGVDYFNFLTEFNKSTVDASAQYAIQKTALEWLQWDLYRDVSNNLYAAPIVKINNALKIYSATKVSDSKAIALIRQMKQMTQQLDIRTPNTLKKPGSRDSTIKDELEIGEKVIHVDYNKYKIATVVAVENSSLYTIFKSVYTLKYENGQIVTRVFRKDIAQTKGCGKHFCANDITYRANISSEEYEEMTIVGYQPLGDYIVKSQLSSNRLIQLNANRLFSISGCNKTNKICVGDKMYYTMEEARVVVIGFHNRKLILIKVEEGKYKDQLATLSVHELEKEAPLK